MNILHIALIISLASLGVRAVTDKGMIFYFLRRPFDKLQEKIDTKRSKASIIKRINSLKNDIEEMKLLPEDWQVRYYAEPTDVSGETVMHEKFYSKEERIDQWKEKLLLEQTNLFRQQFVWISSFILYLMKPVFMCSTCMASLHTLIWFPILTGELLTYKLILVMLIVSIFNTICWLLVNVMRKFIS